MTLIPNMIGRCIYCHRESLVRSSEGTYLCIVCGTTYTFSSPREADPTAPRGSENAPKGKT